MATRPWHLLSLCDGYGGTELALRSVAPVRTVARVERDAYAAAILVERMGEARLDQCPIWDDVGTFDGAAWRGRVDIVAAGFPCPDFSSAGRRAGVDGEHWLWPECFEVIRQVGPSVVLLENVPGLVRLGGLTRVLSDLADDGFDAEWGCLDAAAIGTPHERERVWIVAVANGRGRFAQVADDGARERHPARRYGSLVDAPGVDEREPHPQAGALARRDSRPDAGGRCRLLGHPDSESDARLRRGTPSTHASPPLASRYPPHREDWRGWADWIAAGGPQPVLRRLADGPPLGLADALHLGGNGLVPQCAAHAWRQLLERGGWSPQAGT